jgi:hypothetical protein
VTWVTSNLAIGISEAIRVGKVSRELGKCKGGGFGSASQKWCRFEGLRSPGAKPLLTAPQARGKFRSAPILTADENNGGRTSRRIFSTQVPFSPHPHS